MEVPDLVDVQAHGCGAHGAHTAAAQPGPGAHHAPAVHHDHLIRHPPPNIAPAQHFAPAQNQVPAQNLALAQNLVPAQNLAPVRLPAPAQHLAPVNQRGPAAEEVHQQALDYNSSPEDEDNDESWEECMEDDPIPTESSCLFCSDRLVSPEAIFIHCRQKHAFDIFKIHKQHRLDCFSYIKLINFIRQTQPSPETWSVVGGGEPPWASDEYMKPVLEDDGLLQFDIEDLSVDCSEVSASSDSHCPTEATIRADDNLLRKLKAAQQRAVVAEDQLKRVLVDLETMRVTARQMIQAGVPDLPSTDRAIENLRGGEDVSYFESYGHYSIHQEMLQDRVRTESYRDAICANPELFRDAVVLDVGCGTGILSMFAARAGAKLVIGVEMSDIIYQTMDIIRENGLEDKIKLVKGRMEDVDLPVDKVDIIISEWMGYFLLFESMLDSVLWARDHYLSDGGIILPDRCTISLAALDDAEMHQRHYGYWGDVYGFKMTCMRVAVQKEASVLYVNKDKIVSDSCLIKEVDIGSCCTKDLEFTSPFSLTMQRDGHVTAIMGYFDTCFTKGSNQVQFSTSPAATQTHWKQTVFIIDQPLPVKQGDQLEGQLVCKKNHKDPRTLVLHLSLGDRTFKYNMQ